MLPHSRPSMPHFHASPRSTASVPFASPPAKSTVRTMPLTCLVASFYCRLARLTTTAGPCKGC